MRERFLLTNKSRERYGHRGNGRDSSTRESWPSRLRRSAVRTSQHHHTGDACPVIALGINKQDHRQRRRRGSGEAAAERKGRGEGGPRKTSSPYLIYMIGCPQDPKKEKKKKWVTPDRRSTHRHHTQNQNRKKTALTGVVFYHCRISYAWRIQPGIDSAWRNASPG